MWALAWSWKGDSVARQAPAAQGQARLAGSSWGSHFWPQPHKDTYILAAFTHKSAVPCLPGPAAVKSGHNPAPKMTHFGCKYTQVRGALHIICASSCVPAGPAAGQAARVWGQAGRRTGRTGVQHLRGGAGGRERDCPLSSPLSLRYKYFHLSKGIAPVYLEGLIIAMQQLVCGTCREVQVGGGAKSFLYFLFFPFFFFFLQRLPSFLQCASVWRCAGAAASTGPETILQSTYLWLSSRCIEEESCCSRAACPAPQGRQA